MTENWLDDLAAKLGKLHPALGDAERLFWLIDAINNDDQDRRHLNYVDVPDKLVKLGKPLAEVVDLLRDHWLRYELTSATGVNAERLLADLERISRAAPPRGRGRPPTPEHVLALVRRLAGFWDNITGNMPFKSGWTEHHEPLSRAACFVHAIVAIIDDAALPQLPEVMDKVVAERRAPSEK